MKVLWVWLIGLSVVVLCNVGGTASEEEEAVDDECDHTNLIKLFMKCSAKVEKANKGEEDEDEEGGEEEEKEDGESGEATEDMKKKHIKKHLDKHKDNMPCIFKCILEERGQLNDDGSIKLDDIKANIKKCFSGDKKKKKKGKQMTKCMDDHASEVDPEAENCEGYKPLQECILNIFMPGKGEGKGKCKGKKCKKGKKGKGKKKDSEEDE